MEKSVPVGEEEVIQINMAFAQRKNFTTEDLQEMPEDVRAEIIDGQIFFFASPKVVHQQLVMNLAYNLKHYVEKNRGECLTLISPLAVRLDENNKTEVQPDIMVLCDLEKVREDAVYGAPDLVIEIVSKSTKHRDYGLKMLKYRTAGVREYWIVDPEKEVVLVYWFEDEEQNDCYSFEDDITFHLFPELRVKIGDWKR